MIGEHLQKPRNAGSRPETRFPALLKISHGAWTGHAGDRAIFEANCQCGVIVEFFRMIRHAMRRLRIACNPQMDFGCAAYCPYAEQCLGTLPEGLAAQKENLLKDRVAVEMKRYFKNDFKRIGHASRVARHAERIGKAEEAIWRDPGRRLSARHRQR
jgi:hypothetical protein